VFAQGDLLTTLLRAEGPWGLVPLGTTTVVWSSTVGGSPHPRRLCRRRCFFSAGGPRGAAYAAQAYRDIEIVMIRPRAT
jgi:hypothetical protein